MGRGPILVVDDEPGTLWAMRQLLGAHGFDCITAADGRSAREALRAGRVRAVLLDAKLPDSDGLDLAAEMRARAPGLPVILMSAYFYGDDAVVRAALESGIIREFIAKPFRHATLLAALEQAVPA